MPWWSALVARIFFASLTLLVIGLQQSSTFLMWVANAEVLAADARPVLEMAPRARAIGRAGRIVTAARDARRPTPTVSYRHGRHRGPVGRFAANSGHLNRQLHRKSP